ncbi:hypothetical protein ABZX40_39760 [Streptomyces sp. NPDC004610]|uniref:hypothetical protein n=1 Tax=unclassified Streptomyces TaxID=2593676 RepID=UPI0033A43337
MPTDPYAVLRALLRAEARRNAPDHPAEPQPPRAQQPERPQPSEPALSTPSAQRERRGNG